MNAIRSTRRVSALFGPASIAALMVAAAISALFISRGTASAHNILASGSYDCSGGWSYAASYVNGGGGGSGDNRLVIVNVTVGGTTLKQYHYFDTLTSHPGAPAGFVVIDHPTVASFQLFSLSGTTAPVAVGGSIKIYSGGSVSLPSSDPAYRHYLPEFSQDPIPQPAGASECATSTSTPTATATPTATSTPTITPTPTPSGPPLADLALSVDRSSVQAGLDVIPLADIPIEAIAGGGSTASTKIDGTRLNSSPLSSVPLSSIPLSSVALSSSPLSSVPLSSVPISYPGGWDAILAGSDLAGVPLQSVTLAQLLALTPPPGPLADGSPDPLTLGQLDLGSTALRSLSLLSLALGSTPLSSIPVSPPASNWCEQLAAVGFDCASIGRNESTIGSATLLELNLAGAPLSSVPLSSVPLSSVGIAGSPLSSVPLSSVPLSSVPLSSVPLSSVPLSSVTLAGAPLSSVPLSSVPLSSVALLDGAVSWCDAFAAAGYTCATLGVTDDSPLGVVVLAFQTAGVSLESSPLSSVPLSSVPLSSVPLSSVPLSSVPLSSVAIQGVPLSSVPLSSVTIVGSPLSSVPLSSVPLSSVSIDRSPLSSIPLSSITGVINCGLVNCATGTLGDAADASAISPSATLGDIVGALAGFNLGDVHAYGSTSIQDILLALGASPADVSYFLNLLYGDGIIGDVSDASPPNLGGITLGDIMLALLIRSDYPWEDISLDAILGAGVTGTGVLNYHATFTFGGGVPSVLLKVTMPEGFRYVSGSSVLTTVGGSGPTADPAASAEELTWTLEGLTPGPVALDFAAQPGLTLGVHSSSALISASGVPDIAIDDQALVTVLENLEPNDDPLTAPIIVKDALYITHISSSEDRDFYRIPALGDGSRISVLLSHQATDNDLALFQPGSTELRPSTGLPLDGLPVDDAARDVLDNQPPPETLQDIKLAPLPLSSISANRGDSPESVASLSPDDSGFYTVEVAGYNGASSADPYVLRVKVAPPPLAPACGTRTFPFPGAGLTGTLPPSVASDVNTLFLVNQKRLGELYGSSAAASAVASVNALALRSDLGVRGAVIPVDGDAQVQAAYAAWDAQPCSPDAANAVVSSINALVDGYRASLPSLANIVIVGADDVVPFARIPDLTRVSNESDFAADALAIDGNNEFAASFITSNVLSDNPYADFNPSPWLNRQIFVPEVAIGRLVESPAEIQNQVDQFIASGGILDPQTALTTGYDFLTDGADAVADSLDGIVGTADSARLINDAWTSSDLSDAFDQHTPVPGITSLNAHFDHYRLLPGAGNTTGDESDLYTSAEIARAPADPRELIGAILFSMGCHSGLNVSNAGVASPDAETAARLLDWPQAFSDQGAAVYVANTGFGYGDTDIVAYSEELMALFATRMNDNLTIGQALTFAKQDYFGALAQYETYDEKVLAQATFYGLPMFRLPPPLGPLAPLTGTSSAVASAIDPITGGDVEPFSADPIFDLQDLGAKGAYYAIGGNADATSGRPIQPVMNIDLPNIAGKTARGIVVTDMESVDDLGFDPVFSLPAVDSAEPELPSDDPFPASIHTLVTFDSPEGPQPRIVLMPAQFVHEAGDPEGIGTERRYISIDGFVTYSDSADVTPPTILETHAANAGGQIAFVVEVSDDLPDNVKRVLVLFKRASETEWSNLDLVQDAGTTRWTGSAPSSEAVQYTVYAIDGGGNVALSTNKGSFHGTEAAAPGDLDIVVTGSPASAGWLFDAQVSLAGNPDAQFEIRVDGGPFAPYAGPVTLTGEGIYFVEARASDQSTGSAIVPLDGDGPAVTLTTPASGASFFVHQQVTADYLCADGGSGLDTCAGDVPSGSNVDTSSLGPKTFVINATDLAGNVSMVSVPYDVIPCATDDDCDTVTNATDNCLNVQNLNQLNYNGEPMLLPKPTPTFNDATHPMGDIDGDACDADMDGDSIDNASETNLGSNPLGWDSDGDRINDGTEVLCGSNPLSASSRLTGPDIDNDELPDACEILYGTNPLVIDSEGDGVADGVEVMHWMTNPLSDNSDGDDCTDAREMASVNGDRTVSSGDQLIIVLNFGPVSAALRPLDPNGDGRLNSGDQLFLSRNLGSCTPGSGGGVVTAAR